MEDKALERVLEQWIQKLKSDAKGLEDITNSDETQDIKLAKRIGEMLRANENLLRTLEPLIRQGGISDTLGVLVHRALEAYSGYDNARYTLAKQGR